MNSYNNNNKSNNKTRNKANKTDIPFVVADTYAYRDLSPKNGTVIRYFIEKNKNELGQRFRVVAVGSNNSPDYSKKPPTIRIPYNLELIKELIEKGTLKTIIVCEGEKDSVNVQSSLYQDGILDTVATTFSNGVSSIKSNWKYADWWKDVFENKKIAVLRDEDDPGREYQKNVVELMSDLPGTEVVAVALPGAEIGQDVSNWLEGKFASDLIETIEATKPEGFMTATEFLEQDLEEESWVIEGLIPKGGYTMLNSQPKIGKTQLALTLGAHVVDNLPYGNMKVNPGKVLYVALEGSPGNLQKRISDLDIKNTDDLIVKHSASYSELWNDMKREIRNKKIELVIIDTLARFDSGALSNPKKGIEYNVQIQASDKYIRLCMENNIGIILQHHAGRDEDRTARNSGIHSTGLNGGAESIIWLKEKDGARTIETVNREGEVDIPPTILNQSSITKGVYLGDSVPISKAKNISNEIYQYISDSGTAKHQDIIREITGRTDTILASIGHLLDNGRIELIPGTPGKEYKVSIPHSDTATGIRNTHTSNSNSNIPTGVTNAEQSSFDEPTPEWNPFAH